MHGDVLLSTQDDNSDEDMSDDSEDTSADDSSAEMSPGARVRCRHVNRQGGLPIADAADSAAAASADSAVDADDEDEDEPPKAKVDFEYKTTLPSDAQSQILLREEAQQENELRKKAGPALRGSAAFVALMLRCEEQQ